MKKCLFVLFCMSLLWNGLQAQKGDLQWNISTTPQYMANNALKFNIDKRLSKKNWLCLSPEIYGGPVNTDNSANGPKSTVEHFNTSHDDEITGFGLSLEDKIFLNPTNKYQGTFMSFGINYMNLNVRFQDYLWKPFQSNGLTYYDYSLSDGNEAIARYEGYFGFGYAVDLGSNCHADFYLGGGFTKSTASSDAGEGFRSFKRYFYDYEYTGAHPVIAVQFGYAF